LHVEFNGIEDELDDVGILNEIRIYMPTVISMPTMDFNTNLIRKHLATIIMYTI